MKLNTDFYKHNVENLMPIEKEIIDLIEKNDKQDFEKILKKDGRIEVVLALSKIRENILNWYDFKKNCNILEVGANFGEITGLLCENASKVISLESSLEKAKAIEKRHENFDNLEIIVGNLDDIELKQKFDYITLIGTLERKLSIVEAKEKLKFYIQKLLPYLNENGKIIIATDNKFGMKYITSLNEDGTILTNSDKAISKNDIINILDNLDLKYKKFYYVLPDYKLANVIYTDKYMPNQDNISRNFTYNDNQFVSYNQTDAYREILKEDSSKFEFFCSSFLIEASNEIFINNQVNFVSYTNIRKDKYRIKTVIYDDKVIKQGINNLSNEHIKQIGNNIEILSKCGFNLIDSFKNNCIESKFINNSITYDKVLINTLKDKDYIAFYKQLKSFKNELLNKLQKGSRNNNIFDKYNINYSPKQLESMNFVKHGFWDIIFQNIFYIDNEMYPFDQEWYDENVPVEFILYRAIKYFPELLNYVSREQVYEELNINQFIELFERLDNMLQINNKDEFMWNLHANVKNGQTLQNIAKGLNEKLEIEKQENSKHKEILDSKTQELVLLNEEYNKLLKEYNKVISSVSWKITKPMRFVKRCIYRK